MTQYRCETCTNKDNCDEYESQAVRDVSIRCGLTCHSDFQSERDKVLDELKRDLKTRFVSSDSQWGRGRNSGLLECCNIIDEYLRQAGEP